MECLPVKLQIFLIFSMYKKKYKKIKKTLALKKMFVYTHNCCDIDSDEA